MLIGWFIWNLCQVETKIISVERIQQYTRIESEAPLVIEDKRPPPSWPSRGTVELKQLQVLLIVPYLIWGLISYVKCLSIIHSFEVILDRIKVMVVPYTLAVFELIFFSFRRKFSILWV